MSDLVAVECPNCSARLKVEESGDTAKTVRCPKCKEKFVVGASENEPPPPKKKRSPAPAATPVPAPAEEAEENDSPRGKKRRARAAEGDEKSGRTGKRKKRPAGLNPLLILGIASGVGLLMVGAIVVALVLMFSGTKTTAPESFANYDAPEGEFACQVPADWELQEAGIKNTRSITVKKGGASIYIRQSLTGSLFGDIAESRQRDGNPPDELSPVSNVHELKKERMAEEFGYNKEEPPTMVMTKGFGKARQSAFTISGVFGKKRGYRVTALANLISYDIICQCPEADWPVLEPTFTKVIASLGHGVGR